MIAPPTTIPEALRAVSETRADVVALQDEERSLTYAELELTTNHVAAEFADRTSLGAPIAIIAEHCAHSAVSMLAATKAGRISVVLDPREPPARLAQLYRLARCELLVASDPVNGLDGPHITPSELEGKRSESPAVRVTPDDVAAVYYTSGSTGMPKGVTFSHANMALRTYHRVERGQFRDDDVYGVLVNLAFGYSSALYVSVFGGFTARMLDISTLGVAAIRDRLRAEPISVIGCVPLVLSTITDAVLADGEPIDTVRMVETGGEALQPEEADAFFKAFPRAEIRHLYGGTETGTIAQEILEPNRSAPSRPLRVWEVLPWQSVQLVDEHGAPTPSGEPGEIAVTGPGVALGYWRDEALTRQWFSTTADGTRTARTGDMGRFTDDGFLVLEGRRDDLVKVLGKRVDLAMVARALTDISDVADAVALADEDGRLVAYVVATDGADLTVRGLRTAIGAHLPDYMVPSTFLLLDAIPRTDRGKLDRARLREVRAEVAAKRAPFVAPTTPTEQRLSLLFTSMLGVSDVGLDDDFLDLGGDSLAVLELLEVVSEDFSIDLHDYLLLESTVHSVASVRELARAIDNAQSREPTDDDIALRPDGTAVLRIGAPVDAGTRLFLVPGAGEGTVRFLTLANALQTSTVYSFHRRGLQTRDRPDRTVEQLATRLVSAMQYVQPAGPYFIGGFSFGNSVAYEMAQQLRRSGQHVALLVMIDALEPDEPQRFRRVQRMRSRVMRFLLGKPSASRVARARELADEARRIGTNYHPSPYDGHTLVVESATDDSDPRWRPELTGPVERLRLDGTHLAMLGPANSAAIAACVDALIIACKT